MAGDLFALSGGDVLVIGVGSAGCRVAGAGALEDSVGEPPQRLAWCAAHSDPVSLIATGLDRKLIFDIPTGPFAARNAARSVAACEAELTALCAGKSAVVVAGVWDEAVASVIIPPLAGALRRRLFTCVIAAGGMQSFRDDAPAELQDAADVAAWFPNGCLVPPRLDVGAAAYQDEADRCLLAATQTLARALAGDSASAFAPKSLRTSLRGNEALTGYFGAATGVQAAFHAADAALAAAERSSGGLNSARSLAAAVLVGQEPSLMETQDLAQRLKRQSCEREPLVGLSAEPSLGDSAYCVLLLQSAGSPNVVPLEAVGAR
jgi:hypothetical protein